MKLTEQQIRYRVRSLYNERSPKRLDLWVFSGITAGVLDSDLVERALNEEIWNVDPDVRSFWFGPCDQCAVGVDHEHSLGAE